MGRQLVIALLCCAAEYANAGTQAYGFGTKSCGAYLDARAHNKELETAFTTWATGLFTGINAVRGGDTDVLKGTDMQGAMYWLDNYCHGNPTTMFAGALIEFVNDREQQVTSQ
jgi:hypothetical protein